MRIKRGYLLVAAALTAGVIGGASSASAQVFTSANNLSDVTENITDSIRFVPGLISGLAYLCGLVFGVIGILKIKDHVENPTQTPLKDGAIRLAAGGALFALPIVYEASRNTIGVSTNYVSAATLNQVTFAVN